MVKDIKELDEIAKLLAFIVANQENYSYVDRIANANSKDIILACLREALRDYHSIIRRGDYKAGDLKVNKIGVERALNKIFQIHDRKELKEVISFISAKALTFSAKYLEGGE